MAVKLRLKRMGKTHRPFYRVCVFDARRARGGRYIESIGHYDPFVADDQAKVTINRERAEYWLKVGAEPSETVASFLRAIKVEGLARPKKKRARTSEAPAEGTKRKRPPKAVIEAAKKKAEKTRLRRRRREILRARAAQAAGAEKS